jgi:hypothetical protein
MATGFLMVAILAALALTFWRPLRHLRSALGIGHLVSTGHVFVILGFVIGLSFKGPSSLTDDLAPVVAFGAGWVGFATGVRFDWRVLRTIPRHAVAVALGPALAAAVCAGGLCAGVLAYAGTPPTVVMTSALLMGGAAATSGPTLVAVARSRRAGKASHARPVLRMIELAAGVDDIVVVVLAIAAFALVPGGLTPLWLVGAGVGGGVLLGGITWLFLGGRATEDERLLLGLAMMVFTAGFAGWLRLSPAAFGAVTAVVLVNLPGERMNQLVWTVRRVERPAVVILMTVIGFHVAGDMTWIFWPLLVGMTLVRLGAKLAVGDLFTGTIPGVVGLHASRHWGLGLAPQGILGLVVSLSFFYVWQDATARSILAAIAFASLLNEILAPWLLLRLLRSLSVRSGSPVTGSAATP